MGESLCYLAKITQKTLTDCKTKMWAGHYYTCMYSAKQNCGKNFHGRQRIKVHESFHLFRLYGVIIVVVSALATVSIMLFFLIF